MKETLLIPANSAFHTPHVSEFNFVSRPWAVDSLLHPSKYAIVTRLDGSVARVDYESMAEYNAHKARIVSQVTKHHERNGSRIGCACTFCRMER